MLNCLSSQADAPLSPPGLAVVDVGALLDARIAPLLRQLVKLRSESGVKGVCEVEQPAKRPGEGPPGRLRVLADADWLVDMLLSLIGNAVKFTARGHVRPNTSL